MGAEMSNFRYVISHVFVTTIFLDLPVIWAVWAIFVLKSNSGGRDLHFLIVWTQTDLKIMVFDQ